MTKTDEERKKLCADLQLIAKDEIEGESWTGLKCKEAADEIERLAKELDGWKQASRDWERLAHRLRKDLRDGTRTVDFAGSCGGLT